MARKNYNEPQIIQNRNGTAGIRFQTVIKRVALAFAIIIGIVALYFSLLPAMADVNGEVREYDGNVYFDNSLSQYDDVQISTDNGANWVSMTKTDKFTRGDIYEYAVSSGTTVMFRGVDSGIVHDTVVNYHINSASREWGYDYNNFSWTSAGMTVGQGNDCYFAPPKLMEYKYGGYAALSSGGIKAVRQFIYHQGDTSDVNSGVDAGISAKPEASTGGERKVYSALFEGDVQGFENATLSTDQKSSGGSSIFSSAKTTVAEQLRLPLSDICEKGATYNVSLDFFSVNGTKGAVYLYDGDTKVGTAPLFNNDGLTANTWTNLSGTLVVPEDCEDPYLQIAANKWDCYVDDVIITTTNAFIMPNSAENRTFWDAEYDMNGYLGEAGTTNLLGDSSQTGYLSLLNNTTNDTLEGSYDKNGDGDNGLSGKIYNATAEFFDYYSDWELAGTPLEEHMVSYGHNTVGNEYSDVIIDTMDGYSVEYIMELLLEPYNFDNGYDENIFSGDDIRSVAPSGYTKAIRAKNIVVSLDNALSDKAPNDGKCYKVTGKVAARQGYGAEDISFFIGYIPTGDTSEVKENLGIATVSDTEEKYVDFEFEFEIPNGATNLNLYIDCGRQFYFDDLSIYREQEMGTATTSEVFNYSFDDSSIPATITSNGGKLQINTTESDSETALCVKLPVISVGNASNGYSYTFSGKVRNRNYYNGTVNMSLNASYTNSNSEAVVKNLGSVSIENDEEHKYSVDKTQSDGTIKTSNYNTKWVDFEFNFTLTEDATNLALLFEDYGGEFFLDDLVLKQTVPPEPNYTVTDSQVGLIEYTFYSDHDLYSNKDTYRVSMDVVAHEDMTLDLDVEYTYTDGTVETLDIGSVDVAAGGDYLSPIQIDFPCFDLPNATTSAKIIVSSGGVSFSYTNFRLVQDFYNVNGSFSQGTGSISYAYQGMLWNQAISGYYSDATALNLDGDTGNDIVPLYFGSNSWMSGNGRYDKIDSDEPFASLFTDAQVSEAMNYPYPTFWNGDTNILNTLQSLFVMADTGKDGGAYLIPFQRHYWKKLSGFDNELSDGYTWIESINEAMGQSNSRGVPGLVKLQYDGNNSKNSILSLTNTDNSRETPYFNDAFIEGENSLNAKLGEYYDDVNFDFVMNTDENSPNNGYYEYDSTRSKYATRLSWNQDIGYYIDYYNYAAVAAGNEDVWGVKKADNDPDGDVNGSSQTINQFYPFNSPDSSNNFATENLMFGMHLDIPFNMYKDKAKREKSVFKFSGDDDVWVYVDGQEVLDIGGTHTAVGGFIDLKNGYSIQGSTFSDYTGLTTDAAGANEAFAAISSSDDGIYNSGTDTGITIAEKAAFAVLASQEEINFLTTAGTIATVDDINNLAVGGATEWTDGIVINGDDGNLSNDSMDEDSTNTTLTKAAFFDDTFIPADGASNISFQYRARRASTDEWVIDIRVRDIRISDTTQKRVDKNISDVEGKEIVTYVNASFSLSTFKLDMNDGISTAAEIDNNADLVDHMLTIYYMERGLNSSNFKLAFNMVPNTEREVQKEWADDKNSEAHNDVTVELYRTEPDLGKKEVITGTEKVTEQTPYNVPNFTYIKVEGAKTDGTYQANQGFYEQDATIQTYYQAYAFDTNVYLTMNGQFIGDFNKGITDAAETFTDANGNGVYDKAEEYSDANSNGSYDAGETYVDADGDGQYDAAETFTDANNDGEYNSGDVIQYAYHYLSQSNLGLKIYFVPTSDAGTTENITLNEDNYSEYIGMDAKGYYFKVPANYQLWIDFNAVDSVRIKNNNESTTVNPYNIYNFTAAQGWLIKSHAYTRNDDGSSNEQVNMEAKLRNKGANTYYDAGTGRTYGKDNIDLKFVITKNTRGYNNGTGQYPFYEYNYNAMIVPVGDSITLTSDVKNFDSSKNATYYENYKNYRYVGERLTNWNGVLTDTSSSFTCDNIGYLRDKYLDIVYNIKYDPSKPDDVPTPYTEGATLWSKTISDVQRDVLFEVNTAMYVDRVLDSTQSHTWSNLNTPTTTYVYPKEVEKDITEEIDTIIYTNAKWIDTVTLNNTNDWYKIWDKIMAGLTMDEPYIDANNNDQFDAGEYYEDLNGNNKYDYETLVDYKYFIREVSADSTHSASITDYKQIYYDPDGNEILPETVDYTIVDGGTGTAEYIPVGVTDKGIGDTVSLTLYPIDPPDGSTYSETDYYAKIVNIPLIDLGLNKTWSASAVQQAVTYYIYRSYDGLNGFYETTQTITSANVNGENKLLWESTFEDLPLYEKVLTNDTWDAAEPYEDRNENEKYDRGESYTDSNGNGMYDEAEEFTDTNGNGVCDEDETFVNSVYEWKQLTYYAVEKGMTYNDDGEKSYIVTYSTASKPTTLKLQDGTSVGVYPLTPNKSVTAASKPSITVNNRANNSGEFTLNVTKVSASDNEIFVSGAQFILERALGGDWTNSTSYLTSTGWVTEKPYKDTDSDGIFDPATETMTNDLALFTSNESGIVSFGEIKNMDGETAATYEYRITEVSTPWNYLPDYDPIYFTMKTLADNVISSTSLTVSNDKNADSSYVTHTFDDDSDTLNITVENEVREIVLPNTGGSGILYLLIGGFGLIAIVLTGAAFRRKRSA